MTKKKKVLIIIVAGVATVLVIGSIICAVVNNKSDTDNDTQTASSISSSEKSEGTETLVKNDSSATEKPTTGTTEKSTTEKTTAEESTGSSKCSHEWVKQTKEVFVDEKGHYEDVVVQGAYDEPVYERHTFCNHCGLDCTTAGVDAGSHCDGCGTKYEDGTPAVSSWETREVKVGTIHHDAVYDTVWVQDETAYTYTEVTGYKCSKCGATKSK